MVVSYALNQKGMNRLRSLSDRFYSRKPHTEEQRVDLFILTSIDASIFMSEEDLLSTTPFDEDLTSQRFHELLSRGHIRTTQLGRI